MILYLSNIELNNGQGSRTEAREPLIFKGYALAFVPAVLTPKQVVEVATNNDVIKEITISNWTGVAINIPASGNGSGVAYSSYLKLFVFICQGGRMTNTNSIWTSSDGENWIARSHPGTNLNWIDVIWDNVNNYFIIVGKTGNSANILSSADGVNWFSRVNPTGAPLYNLIQTSSGVVAYSLSGTVISRIQSNDGINFTSASVTIPAGGSGNMHIAYDIVSGIYILTRGSSIYKSTNGTSFTNITTSLTNVVGTSIIETAGVAYNPIGKFFVIVTHANVGDATTENQFIFTSFNGGNTWAIYGNNSGISAYSNVYYIPYFNVIMFFSVDRYIVSNAGYTPYVYFSSDGKNWKMFSSYTAPYINDSFANSCCAYGDNVKRAVGVFTNINANLMISGPTITPSLSI